LHVLHGGEHIVGTAGYAIDRAADGIAIALLGARESGARSAQRQNALISRLLLGDISGDAFVNRALRIGRDLRDRALLVVSVCREGASNTGEDAMEDLCRSLQVPAVVADLGEHTLVIMGLSRTKSEKQVVARLTDLNVRAGISRPVSASQLPAAVEQAGPSPQTRRQGHQSASADPAYVSVMRWKQVASGPGPVRAEAHAVLPTRAHRDLARAST
jgi:purine catabolism regulator